MIVEIQDIPSYVTSMTLVAEKMVQAIQVIDTLATSIQTSNNNIRHLSPTSGVIHFSSFILPTMDAHKTLLYLDVDYGSSTERYTIKVGNTTVSENNRIRFFPNRVVRISGSYEQINLGFIVDIGVNLDDDAWDGLEL